MTISDSKLKEIEKLSSKLLLAKETLHHKELSLISAKIEAERSHEHLLLSQNKYDEAENSVINLLYEYKILLQEMCSLLEEENIKLGCL